MSDARTPLARGVLSRPRTVFLGDWADAEIEELRPLVGHLWRFSSADELVDQVAEYEVDLLILRGAPASKAGLWNRTQPNCFVIYFPTDNTDELGPCLGERFQSKLMEYEVTPDGGELGQLMREATESLSTAVGLPRWKRSVRHGMSEGFTSGSEWLARTLVDKAPFAFFDVHGTEYVDVPAIGLLVVPDALCRTVPYWQWISAAARSWQGHFPAAFPNIRHWKEDLRWLSKKEADALRNVEELALERQEAMRNFDSRLVELRAELQQESARADANERRLLTTQGDELTDAVSSAFSALGFDILVPGEEATSAKAEDLVLSRREWEGWSASVEIKGFRTTGVKVVQAVKLSKRRDRRKATQALLVVNSEFAKDPAARHPPFSDNQDARDSVVELGVLVLDTRELYQVINGTIPAETLIEAIRYGSGVFENKDRG